MKTLHTSPGRGWIDIRGDQLRDAAKMAEDIDPHDAESLRLEYLSDGTLMIHALGKNRLVVVSGPDDA